MNSFLFPFSFSLPSLPFSNICGAFLISVREMTVGEGVSEHGESENPKTPPFLFLTFPHSKSDMYPIDAPHENANPTQEFHFCICLFNFIAKTGRELGGGEKTHENKSENFQFHHTEQLISIRTNQPPPS